MRYLLVIIVLVTGLAASTDYFRLLKISENEIAVECVSGREPVVGKTAGGVMVVTCPKEGK